MLQMKYQSSLVNLVSLASTVKLLCYSANEASIKPGK